MTPIPDERAALDDLASLPGLTWRRATRDDLTSLAELRQASERFDASPERTTVAELTDYWDSERSVPTEDLLLVHDEDGTLVASGWSGCNRSLVESRRVHLGGTVHPDHRGRGIGSAVLRWELAHGQAWDAATRQDGYGPLVMRAHGTAQQEDLAAFLARHDLWPVRWFVEMERRLDGPVPATTADGIRLVDWDPARSEEVRVCLDTGFRDHWGFAGISPQMWHDQVTGHAFRPGWTVLAVDATDRVVGVATGAAYEQDWAEQGFTQGWTDQLTVLREHRGRGVATALLHEQMRRFAADGIQTAGLGVDSSSLTGALRLYEGLGYEAVLRTVAFEHGAAPGR
ncbi:GNAT family N-acetyltransferase [Arsenicicoccus sp. oral taxon 190]|uniref:GNAT family N-acetyltransferase n=1 Tax=Arsenicicoccus sp. oral taxon 190 TaxID=1658671 RepID=UPI00067A08D4|nr:GNAT family N-acetyltransferase [Arsenicicoccus sp. oral taxon 190]AKT52027.1 hypothetical protein ADJ73_13410 [Arsenicicoccus sp. oral taxon 190]